ncbi:MAG: DNA-binding protein AraC-type [Paenibacillus sp.]|nr:DNA-binding protein AraC-type [Paenibacillus sp.]
MYEIRFHHAGDVTVKPGHLLQERKIPDYELVYFPVGTQTIYTASGLPSILDQPCVIMTRPGELHSYQFDPKKPTRHLYIHFDGGTAALRDRFALLNSTDVKFVILQDYSLVPLMIKQLLFYFHRQPEQWKRLAESLFIAMLEELDNMVTPDARLSIEQTKPIQIESALQYIDDHMTEAIDISQLARHVGWSHEHFTRTFQQHTGLSPKKWIIRRRLDMAAQLLLQRTDSIKQIAKSVGFTDEYYFHRLFARQMGVTASEYRRAYGDKRMLQMAPPAESQGRLYPLNHFFRLEQRNPK